MKIMQESLSDGNGQSESTVTVYEVWLDWEAKLRKFWEGQSGLQEGKARMLCAFFIMNGQRGWIARFAQFSIGTGRVA